MNKDQMITDYYVAIAMLEVNLRTAKHLENWGEASLLCTAIERLHRCIARLEIY